MKYGITYANGTAESFADSAEARAALFVARGAMLEGETVSLWSESETGSRVTLQTVYQPAIADFSTICN